MEKHKLEEVLGNYTAMEYITEISMEKQKDGEWIINHKIIHKVGNSLDNLEERFVDFQTKNYSLEKAITEAAILASLYLESVKYDLFNDTSELKEGEYLQ